jgi:hypothetical protein
MVCRLCRVLSAWRKGSALIPVEGGRVMRRIVLFAALLFAGLLAVPSAASATPGSGTEHFELTGVNNDPFFILATGVFTASGIEYTSAAGASPFLAVFSDGTFLIHAPGGTFTTTVNPRTCLETSRFSGGYTINDGFGAFQGIRGSGTYLGHTTGVVPRNPNGTCSNGPPFSTVTRIFAKGPISF